MRWFKTKRKKYDDLLTHLNTAKTDVATFVEQYGTDPVYGNRYCTHRGGPCTTSGFYFWQKRSDHSYNFANEQHCIEFFGLTSECSTDIRGKYDVDLINQYRERTGKQHTYGDLCSATDDIVKDTLRPVRFLELGYIASNLVILDVTKYPLTRGGKYSGSYGLAIDIAKQALQVNDMIRDGLLNGHLSTIDVQKNTAVYRFKDEPIKHINIFKNGFPK